MGASGGGTGTCAGLAETSGGIAVGTGTGTTGTGTGRACVSGGGTGAKGTCAGSVGATTGGGTGAAGTDVDIGNCGLGEGVVPGAASKVVAPTVTRLEGGEFFTSSSAGLKVPFAI